ncbi:MAG: hypothetical protein P8Y36_13650 [Alphaproteobacteria bacterium]
MKILHITPVLATLLFLPPAFAGAENYDASNMWGTAPAGTAVQGALESAAMHVQNGVVAGQVNSAKDGLLYANGSGESYSIYSIGSQAVVSNNIVGNNNDVSIDADQQSENHGNVSNSGQINPGDNAINANNTNN